MLHQISGFADAIRLLNITKHLLANMKKTGNSIIMDLPVTHQLKIRAVNWVKKRKHKDLVSNRLESEETEPDEAPKAKVRSLL